MGASAVLTLRCHNPLFFKFSNNYIGLCRSGGDETKNLTFVGLRPTLPLLLLRHHPNPSKRPTNVTTTTTTDGGLNMSSRPQHEQPAEPAKLADHHHLRSSSFDLGAGNINPQTHHHHSHNDELQRLVLMGAPMALKNRKRLTKQLSMLETTREAAWEKRRRQILRQERRKNGYGDHGDQEDHQGVLKEPTDEDLNELRGCIELGFGFNEEHGQELCHTLPALDLYFAVNRQLSPSPVSTPSGSSSGQRSSGFGSPRSDSDSWKICNPGDDPQQVKTKLRHWAQAVACSVRQSY